MTSTTTKNFISKDNTLYKARLHPVLVCDDSGSRYEDVEQIKKNGKWINLEERGKYIKTKTIYCTKVNQKSELKKYFKEGKRYQVNLHAGLGQSAGYIYDEDGNAWQLYRSEDVGFYTLCQTYLFEAQYK